MSEPTSFVEYIESIARQCDWQIRTEGYDSVVYLDFTLDEREEVVDVSYLTHPNGATVINFASKEIPLSAIKQGDDMSAEYVFDNYFLKRNMATVSGRWGVLQINEEKNYVFMVRIEANKLTPEEFRSAVLAILDERQKLFEFVTD